MLRNEAIDKAVKAFLAEHYPDMPKTWLKNRAAWGTVSTLDLKAIRERYNEALHAAD